MNVKQQRIARRKQKAALGVLVASVIIPIGLSFFAEPISTVTLASVAAFMVTLFSGIAWVYPERTRGNAVALRHKRRVLIACLALIASVPLTHWPLRTSFAFSRQELSNAVNQAKDFRGGRWECGSNPIPYAFPSAPIRVRAGMFYLTFYSTGSDDSIKLHTRGGWRRHSAFQQ